MTDEPVMFYPWKEIHENNTLPNVQWLVPLCHSLLTSRQRVKWLQVVEMY